jgi:hypothetical protein
MGTRRAEKEEERMLDVLVIVVSLVAFVALIGLTVGCERL